MRHLVWILGLLLLLAPTTQAATFTIVNLDGANEGFNDTTPATPIGGNTGTTIGEQRLIAFQFAADVWGAILPSNVDIRIRAAFNPQTCDATSGVLGSAGAVQVFEDFPNAIKANTWYSVALANKLADFDLAPSGSQSDDISATFNSDIDNNPNCLANSNWYYGLDGNNGSDIDLVVVLLHEFGHGLGFQSFVNQLTGDLFAGLLDVYSSFLYDNDTMLHWGDMNNAQRAASVINTQRVAFDGPLAVNAAATTLGPKPGLIVNAPGGVVGFYEVGEAGFGPSVATTPATGDVVLLEDGTAPVNDGCEPITNAGALSGNIAMIDRGACSFASKVEAAQAAGAIGVIIVNNVAGPAVGMGGSSGIVTIPSVMVSIDDGNLLKAELGNGLNATIGVDTNQQAGADPIGRPLIFTPNPRQSGSSVSHWDTSASPNLLMEPAINSSLPHDSVDLTLPAFTDLGWLGNLTPAPVPTRPTELAGNFPNPFNPTTTIRFELASDGLASLRIFDMRGRHIRTLVTENLTAGTHDVSWNGQNDDGDAVASGVYFYRLETNDFRGIQRMVLLK